MTNNIEGDLNAKGFKFGIVVSRFNDFITSRLVEGAVDALVRHGAKDKDIDIVKVPGAFEIPMTARKMCAAKKYDAILCLGAVIRETLREFGHEATPDALAYLSAHLGGDRQLSRRELEKLALYKGGEPGPIELVDAQACVGDSAALSVDDLAYAVGGGAAAAADRALARSLQEGVQPVAALRAVSRHFQRLHLVVGLVENGLPLDDASKRLRPPLFWKVAPAFRTQAAAWSLAALARALARLLEAEADCKSSGAPEATICGRALLEITVNAPSRRRRAG